MTYDPLKYLIREAAEEALYQYRNCRMDRCQALHYGRGYLLITALERHGEGRVFRNAAHRARLSMEAEDRLHKARSERRRNESNAR